MPKYSCFLAAALGAGFAVAQQPAPPAFAPSNLTPAGVMSLAANCAGCHGTNGVTPKGSAFASLAGRRRDDLLTALTQFKEGKRPATVMHQIAKGYTGEELAALAGYFSKQSR